MEEEWRTVMDMPWYSVSSAGRVRSTIARGHSSLIRKPSRNTLGYMVVVLRFPDGVKRGRGVHRLVAQAFIPNPDGLPEVEHLNMLRDDNRVENLAWIGKLENRRNRRRNVYQRCQCCDACQAPIGNWTTATNGRPLAESQAPN